MYRWSPVILIFSLLLLSVVLYSRKVDVDVDISRDKNPHKLQKKVKILKYVLIIFRAPRYSNSQKLQKIIPLLNIRSGEEDTDKAKVVQEVKVTD